jgi:hypothetical protein
MHEVISWTLSVRPMLTFSRLQPDLLPRFAARDNNVKRIAGTHAGRSQ